jgi:hypothetical protein
MDTPVALIIFNRPDKTKRVLQAIAAARPRQLFVIADGPRPDRPEDAEKCGAARAIIEQVNWPCEVVKNYSDVNLGCGARPATGISWVFDQVNEAIILEDDCVPHPTFFPYCQELLHMYREDTRIMSVGGFTSYKQSRPHNYYFSVFPICSGGWATWRRAWRYWDGGIKLWPTLRETSWLRETLGNAQVAQVFQDIFDRAYAEGEKADYWDYQWIFACWAHSGLSILPTQTNLLSNIGFDEEGTHTKSGDDPRADAPTEAIEIPLRHPPCVLRDREMDRGRLQRWSVVKDARWGSRARRWLCGTIPQSLRTPILRLRSVRAGSGQGRLAGPTEETKVASGT